MDAVALLATVEDALKCGKPVPPDAARWLLQGLESYRAGADLEVALLLRGETGQRSVRYRASKLDRDTLLIQAWEQLPQGSPWQRSQKLALDLKRYRATGWNLDQKRNRAGKEKDQRLFEILSSSPTVPTTAQGIHKIATKRGAF